MQAEKKTVDARGLFCPGPLQVLKGVLRHLDSGEALELLADDPESKRDIEAWCEAEGHGLKSVTEKDGTITFLVIKK
jgi:TusA-related sulfurtransferase